VPLSTTALFIYLFINKFNTSFFKILIFKKKINTIMLRCVLKISKNMSLKIFSNCVFGVKIALNYFYATFK